LFVNKERPLTKIEFLKHPMSCRIQYISNLKTLTSNSKIATVGFPFVEAKMKEEKIGGNERVLI